MENIDIANAQQNFPELIERTIRGSEIIITREGRPIVKLTALPRKAKQRQFGTAKGLIKITDDFDAPLDDFKAYT
jgi:prevent-host-death family protein